jgi:hypothetical protein
MAQSKEGMWIKLLYASIWAWITMWSKGRCDMNFQCIVGFVYCKKFAIKIFPNFLVCYGKKKPIVYWPIWVLLNTRFLNGNAFSGSIEHVFQGLNAPFLTSMDLSSNQLTGCIPGLTTGIGNYSGFSGTLL